MEKGLVSIMIPCYNGEKFLDRLFESLILQTYKKLQIIFVNDGSKDKTEKIAFKYRDYFETSGMKFLYLYQENKGQAAAINNAIRYLEGEYCMWFDADDYMTENHIEKKINFMSEHPEYNLIMCKGYVVSEDNIGKVITELGDEQAVGTLFEDIIFEFRRCTPGLYMARTKELLLCLNNKKIYESRVGQNMQLLLPIAQKGRNGFLEENLFYYVVRENSHSRSFYNSEDYIKRYEDLEDVKIHVIKELKLKTEYKEQILYHIKIFSLIQKIQQLGENIDFKNLFYINKLKTDFLNMSEIPRFVNGRMLFLWGVCQISEKIKKVLELSAEYQIKGYIDSDKNKRGLKISDIEIYDAEILDPRKIYLIIPLEEHYGILEKIQKKGYALRRDFFYPKLELQILLKDEEYAYC